MAAVWQLAFVAVAVAVAAPVAFAFAVVVAALMYTDEFSHLK